MSTSTPTNLGQAVVPDDPAAAVLHFDPSQPITTPLPGAVNVSSSSLMMSTASILNNTTTSSVDESLIMPDEDLDDSKDPTVIQDQR